MGKNKSKSNPASAKKGNEKKSEAAPRTEEPARSAESDAPRSSRASQPPQAPQAPQPHQVPNQPASFLFPGLLVVGVFLAVAVSFGVQYYQYASTTTSSTSASSKSPAESLKRLNLDHWVKTEMPTYLRNIQKNEFLLNFANLSKSGLGEFGMKLTKGGVGIHLDQLDYFEYLLPQPKLGGKMHLRYADLEVVLSYVVSVGGNDLFLTLQSFFSPPTDGKRYAVVLMDDKGHSETMNLINKATLFFQHPGEKTLAGNPTEQLLGLVIRIENQWKIEFEDLYGLNQQNMPKEYQALASNAICLLKNSFHQRNNFEVQKGNEKLIVTEKLHFLKSIPNKLNSLDEQVFPLITLSRVERDEVLAVFNSWLNLIDGDFEVGNRIVKTVILMEKAQSPMMFQLIKDLLPHKGFRNNFDSMKIVLEIIADHTWKHSVGEGGLKDVKWLGHSRGLWRLEQATPKNTSSFELLCLLEDMARVMNEFASRVGSSESQKWAQRAKDAEAARSAYWDDNEKKYGDLVDGKIVPGYYSHTPLILGLPSQDSPVLTQLVKNLEAEPLYCNVGLQLSEEFGAPISTNFLLLQSFKRYSALSGPSQEAVHRLYSKLKNSLIAAVAQNYRRERSFYARFDKNLKAIGPKGSLDGTLILPIMAELNTASID